MNLAYTSIVLFCLSMHVKFCELVFSQRIRAEFPHSLQQWLQIYLIVKLYRRVLDILFETHLRQLMMGLLKHFSSTVLKEDTRSARLDALVSDAEKRVVDLSAAILNASSGSSSMSNTQQKVCSVIFKLFKTPLF